MSATRQQRRVRRFGVAWRGEVLRVSRVRRLRRILAEERLAQLEVSLAEARQRSVNAHERAARVDAAVGKAREAAQHQRAADRDRQLI